MCIKMCSSKAQKKNGELLYDAEEFTAMHFAVPPPARFNAHIFNKEDPGTLGAVACFITWLLSSNEKSNFDFICVPQIYIRCTETFVIVYYDMRALM